MDNEPKKEVAKTDFVATRDAASAVLVADNVPGIVVVCDGKEMYFRYNGMGAGLAIDRLRGVIETLKGQL